MPDCSVIMTDHWTGAFEAVTHLFALGHRRLMHCYGEWDSSYPHQQRVGGMRQACEPAGKPPAEVLRVARWNYDDPSAATRDILAMPRTTPP